MLCPAPFVLDPCDASELVANAAGVGDCPAALPSGNSCTNAPSPPLLYCSASTCDDGRLAAGACFYHGAVSLQDAVKEWCSNQASAEATHGDMGSWDTSGVGSMAGLIRVHCSSRSTFDGDVSNWNTARVTNMFHSK